MKTMMIVAILAAFVACDSAGYADPSRDIYPDATGETTLANDPNPPSFQVLTVALEPAKPPEEYQAHPKCLVPPPAPEMPLETAILDRAMLCNRSRTTPDRTLLLEMLRYEEEFNVPLELRGMVLAAACHESGFTPDIEGDHRFSKDKKTPKAIGILQQWPWWETSPWGPKINRRNPRQAARAWVAHVVKQVPKVRRNCRLKRLTQEDRLWKVSWLTAIRSPSKTPRCFQSSQHWKRFVRWRKSWAGVLIQERGVRTAMNER
jgi:hypothetical protein